MKPNLTEREIDQDARVIANYISLECIKKLFGEWQEHWKDSPRKPVDYYVLERALEIVENE